MRRIFSLTTTAILIHFCTVAQNDSDLVRLVGGDSTGRQYVNSTFKSTRVIIGPSVETLGKNGMDVRILHRFGYINSGVKEFFGWDQGAEMRFGFDFGITPNITVGVGRSSFDKAYDASIKWRPVRQARGEHASPVSIAWATDFSVNTRPSDEFVITPNRLPSITRIGSANTQDIPNDYGFSDRWSIYTAIIVGRKFSDNFSFQVTPEVVLHHNYALRPSTDTDINPDGLRDEVGHNDVIAMGFGARYKFSKRMALVVDYHHVFTDHPVNDGTTYYDPLAIGFDIETGGHVFQLHVSNTRGLNENAFLTQTYDDFWKGDIRFGFNLSRLFTVGAKKEHSKSW